MRIRLARRIRGCGGDGCCMALVMLAAVAWLTASCVSSNAQLVVEVEGDSSLAIFQLAVSGTLGGQPFNLRVPTTPRRIELPTSFGMRFSEEAAGFVELVLDAYAEDESTVLASGGASGALVRGETLTLRVSLGAPRPRDGGSDGLAGADAGADDAGNLYEDAGTDGAVDGPAVDAITCNPPCGSGEVCMDPDGQAGETAFCGCASDEVCWPWGTCNLATGRCQCGDRQACVAPLTCNLAVTPPRCDCGGQLCAGGESCGADAVCNCGSGPRCVYPETCNGGVRPARCDCNGKLCAAGETCSDPDGENGPSAPACTCTSCPAGHVCDPVSGQCRCGSDPACPAGAACLTFYRDSDGDGYGDPDQALQSCSKPAGTVSDHTDCNDGDKATHPGASDACDKIDQDCDGQDGTPEVCGNDIDEDCDGRKCDPPCRKLGDGCSAPDDRCCTGQLCQDGFCCKQETQSCGGAWECCSGVCCDGKCAKTCCLARGESCTGSAKPCCTGLACCADGTCQPSCCSATGESCAVRGCCDSLVCGFEDLLCASCYQVGNQCTGQGKCCGGVDCTAGRCCQGASASCTSDGTMPCCAGNAACAGAPYNRCCTPPGAPGCGGNPCCVSGATCTSSGGQQVCCEPAGSKCDNTRPCCSGGTCLGGTCCASAKVCGSACCGAGTVCADANRSLCCAAGVVACNGVCCGAGQECNEGVCCGPCNPGLICYKGRCRCMRDTCTGCCADNYTTCRNQDFPSLCRESGGWTCVVCSRTTANACGGTTGCLCGTQAACDPPRECRSSSCCIPPGSTGCTQTSQCCSGSMCGHGTCCIALGSTGCSAASECCSGTCSNSKCCLAPASPCSTNAQCCSGACYTFGSGKYCG